MPVGEGAAWGRPATAPARGGSGVGKASAGDGGEGQGFDPFCVRSVLMKVIMLGVGMEGGVFFFHELKLPKVYSSGWHPFHNGKIAKPL